MRTPTTVPPRRRLALAGLTAAAASSFFLAGCPSAGSKEGLPIAAAAPVPAVAKLEKAPEAAAPGKDALPSLGEGDWTAVIRGDVTALHPAPGIFRARQTTKLGSQVNGRIRDVLVDVGDRVKAGQELIRLEPAFFDIEVVQRKADIDAARVAREDAELNFNRMKNLWEKPDGKEPSISRKLFDDAKARLESSVAHEKQAGGSLANAEERRKESIIRAPYDGVVTRRMVDPGEPVTSAPVTELLEVREVARLDLEFSLPQELLARVRAGTPVEWDVEGVDDGKGRGEISVIFPALDEATRTFRCRLMVENPGAKFRPGVLVKVWVVVAEARGVLAVPPAALARTGAGWEATVLAGGRPERRPVEIGIRSADRFEVRAGLSEGEKVWVPRFSG